MAEDKEKKELEYVFVKIKDNSSAAQFQDERQPEAENRKLFPGQIKKLLKTPKVSERIGVLLIEVNEDKWKQYNEKQKAKEAKPKEVTASSDDEAKKKAEAEAKKKADEAKKKAEAEAKKKAEEKK